MTQGDRFEITGGQRCPSCGFSADFGTALNEHGEPSTHVTLCAGCGWLGVLDAGEIREATQAEAIGIRLSPQWETIALAREKIFAINQRN